ncbi:MAG: hypothetical protein BroJett040_23450 [Oligoflexia bacterium]|nr:MAG: hypothetical protein BroJett040_23450 [Oligoflexia bacterium]
MNNNNDQFVAVILGLAVIVFVSNLITKAINYAQKFYEGHKSEIFMVMITVSVIAAVVVGLWLYSRFLEKQEETRKFIALQAENTRQLIEAKRTQAMLQKQIDVAPAVKPVEIPRPKKLSLAARAAKET